MQKSQIKVDSTPVSIQDLLVDSTVKPNIKLKKYRKIQSDVTLRANSKFQHVKDILSSECLINPRKDSFGQDSPLDDVKQEQDIEINRSIQALRKVHIDAQKYTLNQYYDKLQQIKKHIKSLMKFNFQHVKEVLMDTEDEQFIKVVQDMLEKEIKACIKQTYKD